MKPRYAEAVLWGLLLMTLGGGVMLAGAFLRGWPR